MNQPIVLDQISNNDLRWDGTALGLQPRIESSAAIRLVSDRSIADDELKRVLRDPQRFAIAHVVLTMRSGKVASFDANQWNGLRVRLEASGMASYQAADMETLAQAWGGTK
jgi:hypothetical protein